MSRGNFDHPLHGLRTINCTFTYFIYTFDFNYYKELILQKAPTIPYTKKIQYSSNRYVYVHDIQKLLEEMPELNNFNPLIITERNKKPVDNELITIHRYTTGILLNFNLYIESVYFLKMILKFKIQMNDTLD